MIVVASHFVNRVHAKATNNYGIVHADESSFAEFHYSTVLHLTGSTDGNFEGGDFVFSYMPSSWGDSDIADEDAPVAQAGASTEACSSLDDRYIGSNVERDASGRLLTRLTPVQGRVLLFSSGWENVHYVDRVTKGVRFALPVFFCTTDALCHYRWARKHIRRILLRRFAACGKAGGRTVRPSPARASEVE